MEKLFLDQAGLEPSSMRTPTRFAPASPVRLKPPIRGRAFQTQSKAQPNLMFEQLHWPLSYFWRKKTHLPRLRPILLPVAWLYLLSEWSQGSSCPPLSPSPSVTTSGRRPYRLCGRPKWRPWRSPRRLPFVHADTNKIRPDAHKTRASKPIASNIPSTIYSVSGRTRDELPGILDRTNVKRNNSTARSSHVR